MEQRFGADFVFNNMLKRTLCICWLLISFYGISQYTFHKIYTLGDTTLFFNSVSELDSVFIVSGSLGLGNERLNAVVIELEKNGQCIDTFALTDPNYLNLLGYSGAKMDTNIFGEYFFHYNSGPKTGYNLYRHTTTKYNRITKAFSHYYLDTLSNNAFSYVGAPQMIMNNSDSTYITNSSYIYFSVLDTNSTLPDNSGFFVIKFSQSSDSILWLKRFTYNLIDLNGPSITHSTILSYDDGGILVIYVQIFDVNAPQQYSKIIFKKLDKDGNLQQTKYLQDTPFSRTMFGSAFLNNKKDLLICYTNSVLITPTVGQPYWGLTPAVARLDSNFNIVWKKDMGGVQYNPSQLNSNRILNDFVIVGDTASVGGYFRSEWIDQAADISSDFVRIENRQLSNGEPNWERDYWFYPEGSMIYNPAYEIRDVEQTSDGGFIFVGEINIWDSLLIGAPSQLGYILKTNCLGFLGDPEVGFSHETNDSLGVSFTNTSLMAGSYSWNFGDSTTLQTGEDFDSIFHQYAVAGDYEVSLIGYGCNGENDTIRYTITVPEYTPEPTDTVILANPNIVNYMALGPNPVKSGESIAVYVGNLPSANAKLSFYNYEGKLVLQRPIPQSKSTYIISLPFSAGVYQAVLREGKETLEVEKVLVY